MSFLSEQKDGTISLLVYVQPRASKNCIAGLHADALKLSITSPPVDGKANSAIIDFLAKFFRIPKTAITIERGRQTRTKLLTLTNISFTQARQILDKELQHP